MGISRFSEPPLLRTQLVQIVWMKRPILCADRGGTAECGATRFAWLALCGLALLLFDQVSWGGPNRTTNASAAPSPLIATNKGVASVSDSVAADMELAAL